MAKKNTGVLIKVHSKHLTAQKMKRVFERGALPELAQEMLQNCNEYCPKDNGDLMKSGHVEDGGKYLVWDTKYAAKVYYTSSQNIYKQKNPKAAARWCEVAERRYSKHWAEKATALVGGKK